MRITSIVTFLAVALLAPYAKADITYIGSQLGINAFNVKLHQNAPDDVQVTVSLTSGATFFVDSGSGSNHPGFAFNIAGAPAISIANLSAPWNAGDIHLSPVSAHPTALGSFDYFLDNPGPGSSQSNPGPLVFDVMLGSGISINDFVANAKGFYFAADIMGAEGRTGMSGINLDPAAVPEPSSVSLLLLVLAGAGYGWKKRTRLS